MRRIAAEHIIATGNKDKRWTDVYLHLEEEVKTAVEALQRERDEYARMWRDGCNDRGAAHKEIEDLTAALNAEREKVKALDAMYRQQLEGRDKRIENLAGSAKIWMEKLTQLQALVRALPVPEEGGFPIVEVDGDYYVNHTSRFSTKAEADAYTGLLTYRATLDATTPAPDTSIIGKCEPPSQWDPNAQVRGDIS